MIDDPATIMRKFKRAVTDSDNEVRYDPVAKPGVSNLLEILGAATGRTAVDRAAGYTQYGRLKIDTGEAVVAAPRTDPAALRRTDRRPGRALAAAARRVGQGPRRSPRRPSSAPTRRSGCCPLESTRPAVVSSVGSWTRPTGGSSRSAIPALGALAVEPLYVLVDTAIVGRLGTEQLAGLALAATVLSFVVLGSNFLTYGTTERVARTRGRRRSSRRPPTSACRRCGCRCWSVCRPRSSSSSAPSRSAGCSAASGDVLDHATDYLQISAVGVPFVLVTLAAQGVLRGVSDYLHSAHHPVRVEPRQHGARDRVRVRARPRHPRIGVVDGDRPGRRPRSRSSWRLRPHLRPA